MISVTLDDHDFGSFGIFLHDEAHFSKFIGEKNRAMPLSNMKSIIPV